jgi:hypothetical protein
LVNPDDTSPAVARAVHQLLADRDRAATFPVP